VFIGDELQPPGELGFVIDHEASGLEPPDPSLIAGLHEWNSSPSLLDVAPASWGPLAGQLFVAEWGDLAPPTNPLRDQPVGYQITRVDPDSGRVVPFVRNARPGPASAQGAQGQGLERPFDAKFGPDGALYIVDYGIARINPALAPPYEFPPGTGAIWRVTGQAEAAEVVRLEAGTNVDAAVAYSQQAFPFGTDRALVARDDLFADSLTSGSLQGLDAGSPLLLTDPGGLSQATADELERLDVSRVTILGGTEAVSIQVETQLRDLGYEVDRVSGSTRIDTAIAIALSEPALASSTSAIVARAGFAGDPTQAFADSLAAGAASANAGGVPILLTDTDALSSQTRDYLSASQIEMVVIKGGPDAVSERTQEEIEGLGIATMREAGATRAGTAVEVARIAFGYETVDQAPGVILVDGYQSESWASGFPAAALAGQTGYPVLLSNGAALPPETADYLGGAEGGGTVALVCGPFTDAAACDQAAALLGLAE